jgi:hypothetical protein
MLLQNGNVAAIWPRRPKHLLFQCSVAVGLLLSVLLLVETVETYRYVAGDLVREEAQRESIRYFRSIVRAARLMGDGQPSGLGSLLGEVARDYPHQIAWIRVMADDAQTVATSDRAGEGPKYSRDELRTLLARRPIREWRAASGPVLLLLNPLVLRSPDGPASALSVGPQESVEIALYVNGISVNFGPLRQDLVVELSAALVLLASAIIALLRFGEYVHAKQIETELAQARQVQLALFPNGNSVHTQVEFAARCVPVWEVGGDLYDVFATHDGTTVFVLGDVSGKGLSAALLMGLVQGAVRVSCDGGAQCHHTAEHLNRLLRAKTTRERFVTMFWCTFDARTNILRYVNAGHCPPFLFRGTGEMLRLTTGGPVMGVLPNARYEHGEIMVQPSDLLVLFSDGIIEASDSHDQQFGEDRLTAIIDENRDKPPDKICDSIFNQVKAFLGAQAAEDDQTLVIARLEPH